MPRTEAYNAADWQAVGSPPGNVLSYAGVDYNTFSVNADRSLQQSKSHSNLLRFQVQAGDEWSGDVGRSPAYDRSELGSYAPYFNSETWFSFATLAYGSFQSGTRSIFQIFNDEAELQVQSSASGVSFVTYDSVQAPTVRHTAARIVDGYPDQWVIRAKPDVAAGELQAWRNGVQLFNLSGLAFGTAAATRKFKRGIYMQRVSGTLFTLLCANMTRSASSLLAKVSSPDALPPGW